jgi:hypothetical protein
METHGVPNDFMYSLNPIAVIILLPITDRPLLPTLRRMYIKFHPVAPMSTVGRLISHTHVTSSDAYNNLGASVHSSRNGIFLRDPVLDLFQPPMLLIASSLRCFRRRNASKPSAHFIASTIIYPHSPGRDLFSGYHLRIRVHKSPAVNEVGS